MKIILAVCLCGLVSSLSHPLLAQSNAPSPYHSGPLNVIFRGAVKLRYAGNAQVISSPPSIDCPGVCSFKFVPGQRLTLTITADRNSYASGISPPVHSRDRPCQRTHDTRSAACFYSAPSETWLSTSIGTRYLRLP
jgi:hypothetical protein